MCVRVRAVVGAGELMRALRCGEVGGCREGLWEGWWGGGDGAYGGWRGGGFEWWGW